MDYTWAVLYIHLFKGWNFEETNKKPVPCEIPTFARRLCGRSMVSLLWWSTFCSFSLRLTWRIGIYFLFMNLMLQDSGVLLYSPKRITRFQIFFIFSPTWGRLKPPTRLAVEGFLLRKIGTLPTSACAPSFGMGLACHKFGEQHWADHPPNAKIYVIHINSGWLRTKPQQRGWGRRQKRKNQRTTHTRWFKVTFSSPSWGSLNPLKGSLNHPKKVTLNHQGTTHTQLLEAAWVYARAQVTIGIFNLIMVPRHPENVKRHLPCKFTSTTCWTLRFFCKHLWWWKVGKIIKRLINSNRFCQIWFMIATRIHKESVENDDFGKI